VLPLGAADADGPPRGWAWPHVDDGALWLLPSLDSGSEAVREADGGAGGAGEPALGDPRAPPACFDGWPGGSYCDEACSVAACDMDGGPFGSLQDLGAALDLA
jgi:hypothetical protein